MRLIVTGGSGLLGREVVKKLVEKGHEILNLDLQNSPHPDFFTLKTDLTNTGQVFDAFTMPFKYSEPFPPGLPSCPDAVIHLAAYPRNMAVPDSELFRTNTQSAFNVLDVACKLGVRKIIIASSITVYGVTFAFGDADYASFPADEECACNATDPYALSKICTEKVAEGFARKYNIDIYVLRAGAVIRRSEYTEKFEEYLKRPDGPTAKAHGWSYTDAEDFGEMCHLGLIKSGLGFQVFNATNDEVTNSKDDVNVFLKAVCPTTHFTRALSPREAPCSNAKLRRMLGFVEKHSWQTELQNEQSISQTPQV